MGRPRRFLDADILDAAARAIGRHGPTEFTIRQVAAEAGVSPALVMQRFGNKRGLILAFERHAHDGLRAAFRDAERSPGPRLGALADALVALNADLGPPHEMVNQVAFLAMDLADPELRAHTLAYFDTFHGSVRRLLEAAVAAGELRPGTDTNRLARLVELGYNGALVTWAIRQQARPDGPLRDALDGFLAAHRPAGTA